ncbi:hypothetical protein [Burkholderia cenocepacia]|uniref:hypothetical protein n=1 Tax=Burkholderia cenocepacia TaxID=95486 RepID=UPI000761D566|nr:hypothetical protein [Burkholderia cenocepacia]KWU19117.1 hypothetical protein AS149_12785 [Burkholderia cenocepacia]
MKKLAFALLATLAVAACSKSGAPTNTATPEAKQASSAVSASAASAAAAAAEMNKPRPATYDPNLKPAPVVRRIELNASGGAKFQPASAPQPTLTLHGIPADAIKPASNVKVIIDSAPASGAK